MYGMDVNRRKWRWRPSAATDIPKKCLIFEVKHVFITRFSLWSQMKDSLSQWHCWLCEMRSVYIKMSLRPETHVHLHVCTCSRHASRQKMMTPPLSVWASGAIDRWPGRLFTVKAPSIALLHYVTFNRVLAHWNSAPWCTFHTIHIPSLYMYIQPPRSYVLVTLFPQRFFC